jgi:hypothetical protein
MAAKKVAVKATTAKPAAKVVVASKPKVAAKAAVKAAPAKAAAKSKPATKSPAKKTTPAKKPAKKEPTPVADSTDTTPNFEHLEKIVQPVDALDLLQRVSAYIRQKRGISLGRLETVTEGEGAAGVYNYTQNFLTHELNIKNAQGPKSDIRRNGADLMLKHLYPEYTYMHDVANVTHEFSENTEWFEDYKTKQNAMLTRQVDSRMKHSAARKKEMTEAQKARFENSKSIGEEVPAMEYVMAGYKRKYFRILKLTCVKNGLELTESYKKKDSAGEEEEFNPWETVGNLEELNEENVSYTIQLTMNKPEIEPIAFEATGKDFIATQSAAAHNC